MAAPHIRHLGLPEGDRARCPGAMVAGDTPAIDLQRKGNSPQEVGHENETAIEKRDNRQLFALVVIGDLVGEFVQAGQNRGLMVEDSGDVGDHGNEERLQIQGRRSDF